jgi:hypothetical protein
MRTQHPRLRYEVTVNEVRLSLPSLAMIVAVVGAAAFAAGRTMPTASSSTTATNAPMPRAASTPMEESEEPLPPGHPDTTRAGAPNEERPAGHPPVDPAAPSGNDSVPQADLAWKAPARWQLVPNASTMRIATYRIPRVAGDPADAELSIVKAGGTVDANVERWIGQFGPEGQKTAKRSTRTVGKLDVALVEIKGTYSGGMMMKEATPTSDWALLGAVVSTPDMPHFFKLTGPAKSVAAARAEFDAFVGSLAPR